jgi:hypothetical protein
MMNGNSAQILHIVYYILNRLIMKREVANEERHKNYWKSYFSFLTRKKQRSCSKRAGGENFKTLLNLTRKEVSHE